MKALVKLAVCGVLAMAVQANAQTLQAQKLMQTQTGRAFLQQSLGITTGSAAELTAAMGKLTGPQQAAVAAAIAKFNSQSVAGTTSAAISQNESLARSLFAQNGQVVQVAALVKDTTSRDGVNTAAAPQCDDKSIASALAANGGISFAKAEAAQAQGIIGEAKCAIKNIKSKEANINLGETVGCMLDNNAGSLAVGSQARLNVGAGCLAGALESPVSSPGVAVMKSGAAAQAALPAFQQISANCGYVR